MSARPSTRTRRRSRVAAASGLAVAAVATTLGVQVSHAPVAEADALRQVAVTSTPVALKQPADNLLGRMTPSADAATKGMYAPQVAWPVIPVHVGLAQNGHLISYGTPLNTAAQGGQVYDDWDPALGTVDDAHSSTDSMASYDSFCNNLVSLPDGRMLMVGGNGNSGKSNQTMYYDPQTGEESMGPGLQRERWYSTALRRPDDKVLVVGGGNYYAYGAYQKPDDNSVVATTPEIGDGTGAWTLLNGATSTTAFGALNNRWWYPRAYNAPDGSVFGISGDQLWRMTTTGTGSLSVVGTLPTSMGVSGSSVMYAPGKILVAGGNEVANGTQTTATTAAQTIDIGGTTPKVATTNPMHFKRQWLNLSVLPTGKVFANGGTVVGTNGGAGNSSSTAEVWDPTTATWSDAATAARIRTYHSTSVLMPSGSVFTGGGGVPGPEDNFNAEQYYPAYLFTKDASGATVWADRPKLTSIAGTLTWGGSLTLGSADARQISSVSLISAGSVTHSENTDQRRIPLTFTQNGSSLSATLPTSVNTMPPGTYLLSATDSKGVPSPSQLVTLKRGAGGTVTVYESDRSAGQVGTAGTVTPGIVPMTVGRTVSFQAVDDPNLRIGTAGSSVVTYPMNQTPQPTTRMSTDFVVRTGLAAGGVSLESAATPGSFLVAQADGSVTLSPKDTSTSYAQRATWLVQAGQQGNYTSLANLATPTSFLRKLNGKLVLAPQADDDQFRTDATFSVRPPAQPLTGWYTVTNANSGLRLSTKYDSTANGAGVVQATASNRVTQTWGVVPGPNGHVKIVDAASGLELGIDGARGDAGAGAVVWTDNGGTDHQWDVVPREGRWLLRNVNSKLLLGITNISGASGAAALQWTDNGTKDHLWDLTWAGPVPTGTVEVTNLNSGLPLSTTGDSNAHGATAAQTTDTGTAAQRWRLVGTGNPLEQKVVNAGSGWLLGIQGMSKDLGTSALVWDDNGTADHLWRLVPQGGRYLLVNVFTQRLLGVEQMSRASGTRALQWEDNGTADHLWTLTP